MDSTARSPIPEPRDPDPAFRRGASAQQAESAAVRWAAAAVLALCAGLLTHAQGPDVDARVEALVARMTLEEKLGQLQQLAGTAEGAYDAEQEALTRKGLVGSLLNVRGAARVNAIQRVAVDGSRLKIPLLLGFDVIHGYRTVFPIPLGEAASWDPAAAERSAAIAAAESAAVGLKWTFAPMVDIARDPRWGRIAEGAGEDPYLGMAFARARVRGFQGPDMARPDHVMACVKHYVGYGAAEGGRDYNTTDISEHVLREIYLPPFKAGIIDAGAQSVMSAFNDLNGVPTSANPFTLTQVLRNEWGFEGLVVSDWESVGQLLDHRVAADGADAAAQALTSGVDMEMVSRLYNTHGADLVRRGQLTPATIDEAVRRVLRVKLRLGLFDRPYVDPALEKTVLLSPAHRAAARAIAARSMVLLKNEGHVLPLSKTVASVALIGPLGDDRANMLGNWIGDGKADDVVTLLAGLKAALPRATITYTRGAEISGDSTTGFEAAVEAAKRADVVVMAVGESGDMSGEAMSRTSLDLPGAQLHLVKAVHAAGKPVAVVLFNGRPLSIGWIAEHVPAVLEAWFPGTEAGHAISDVLLGDVNPGGKLPVTVPRSVGQVPIYYNHKSTGRPPTPENKFTSKYIDAPWTPLYPFGFGLSYTSFAIRDLRLSANTIGPDGQVRVTATVSNTGARMGDEVVQLYIQDVASTVTRPVRELKGFTRVSLEPGALREVEFVLTSAELGMYDRNMRFVVEPGVFKVWVGNSSEGGLEGSFTVSQ
jgi:beta-glucosidase